MFKLFRAYSEGRGLAEGKLKWRKSLFNPPHPNLLPLEKEQSDLCPPKRMRPASTPLSEGSLLMLYHKFNGIDG